MLNASVDLIADDLTRYGEDVAAAWVLDCSDLELIRVCAVADWLILHGPATRSGSSMMIATACALAAVYVQEGAPRDLARRRRKPAPAYTPAQRHRMNSGRRPDLDLYQQVIDRFGRHFAVGADARAFWAPPGGAPGPDTAHPGAGEPSLPG